MAQASSYSSSRTQPRRHPRRGSRRGTRKSNGIDTTVGTIFPIYASLPNMHNRVSREVYLTSQQTVRYGSWFATSTVAETFGQKNFQLQDLDQSSTFTSLFDQYRFVTVECWLTPRSVPASGSATTNMGSIVSVVDFDDDNSLGTYATGLDFENALVSSGGQAHYRKFTPHAALAAFTGSFNGYANVGLEWFDAASTNIKTYGLKIASTTTDVIYTYDLLVRYTVQFKNLR